MKKSKINNIRTSKKVSATASKILRSDNSSARDKQLAGSTLVNRKKKTK